MIKKTLKFSVVIAVLLLHSCEEKKDMSSDFTEEFLFTKGIEGPAVDSEGNLYAVNFEKEGTIGVVDQNGQASMFIDLPEGSTGNGIRFDTNDHMFVADYTGHNILRIRKGADSVEVYAHHPELNQPNDIAISQKGILYASDPNWAENTGKLWKIDNAGFQLVESGMGTTNGIEVSPNGKILYVNESVQRKVWKYEIDQQGDLKNKQLFFQFDDHGLDGMRCDSAGNLYICRYGAGKIVVLSPEAKIIREVQLKGKNPSNITFGTNQSKTCYVTLADRGCFESFTANHPGKGF